MARASVKLTSLGFYLIQRNGISTCMSPTPLVGKGMEFKFPIEHNEGLSVFPVCFILFRSC